MVTKYGTIVADPPWRIRTPKGWNSNKTTNALAYSTLSVAEIKALPVKDWAAETSHLYLWVVNRYVEDAYSIAREWGFVPKSLLTWCKPVRLGGLFASNTEYVLFARRGVDGVRGPRVMTSWWEWDRRRHSQKPEAFQDIVERVSPGPYLEMFARRKRLGWDVWGNEVDSDI